MLSSDLQTLLDNRLRYLPEITGKAIMSIDWPTKVIEIGRKYGLHIEDIEELQTVVLKSMTGLLSPTDFETNLISATAASPGTLDNMIIDMNREIFEPIHEFVITNGKGPDPLAVHGLEIQSDDSMVPDAPQSHATAPLEIPASPEPKLVKPQVPGSFDSFFMTTPVQTDHSMIK